MAEQKKPTFWQWLSGMPDYPEWEDYKREGGHLRYDKWKAQGKPSPLGALTPMAQWLTTTPEYAARKELTARGGVLSGLERRQAKEALDATTGGAEAAKAVRWDTIVDEDTQMVVMVSYNKAGEIVDYQPTGQFATKPDALTKWQEAQIGSSKEEFAFKQAEAAREQAWQERLRAQEEQQAQREYEQGQQQFAWQQQVFQAQQEAEKNRQLAQLRANPASWLEYASLAGQTPAIQPWMLPLAPQQYQGIQAGQPIPGYQAGGEKMNLPQLVTPSSQYMSRLSPSMRQQYYGYEQARTGATPEDVSWRLWSQSPPSGRFGGLRRLR